MDHITELFKRGKWLEVPPEIKFFSKKKDRKPRTTSRLQIIRETWLFQVLKNTNNQGVGLIKVYDISSGNRLVAKTKVDSHKEAEEMFIKTWEVVKVISQQVSTK